MLYGYFVEPNLVIVNNIDIHSPRLSNLLHNYKIAHISDLHISSFGLKERRIIKRLKEIDPDIVFITGDTIAWRADFGPAIEFLENIPAKIGAWGVLGNADYSNAKGMCVLCHEQDSNALRNKSNIRFLRNTAEIIEIMNTEKADHPLQLAILGVDDPVTGRADLELTNSQISQEIPKILLAHSADIFDEASEKDIDLILAGHTHGGQVFLYSYFKAIIERFIGRNEPYLKGVFHKGKTVMYVNRGIGTSIIPFRLGVPPEITVLTFH